MFCDMINIAKEQDYVNILQKKLDFRAAQRFILATTRKTEYKRNDKGVMHTCIAPFVVNSGRRCHYEKTGNYYSAG